MLTACLAMHPQRGCSADVGRNECICVTQPSAFGLPTFASAHTHTHLIGRVVPSSQVWADGELLKDSGASSGMCPGPRGWDHTVFV